MKEEVMSNLGESYTQIENDTAGYGKPIEKVKNNVITGIIGAFLGSLIGVALWVGVGLIGYIAAICGIVLAISTIKGYQLFGGKLDKKGIFITILITIVMVFVSQYLSLTLDAYNELKTDYDITILEVLQMMPELLKDSEISGNFYLNLGLGYIFTIAGSVSVFKNSYKQVN